MTREELLGRRWGALLPRLSEADPQTAVARLGALQAQDPVQVVLAVGLRSPGSTVRSIVQAMDEGRIVRTHAPRPAWHLIAAPDLRWMVSLTAPGLTRATEPVYRQWGLTPDLRSRSRALIERALTPGPLTREELTALLKEGGIPVEGLRATYCLFDAEQELVVCSGPRKGKTATYDLVDRRVPPSRSVPREEALAALALRYITGHGPATDRDFAWWSGLGLTEARRGLASCQPRLRQASGNTPVWFDPQGPLDLSPEFRWLPAFDESLVAFADRSDVLSPAYSDRVLTRNGLFRPFVVQGSQIVGIWKWSKAKNNLGVEVSWFDGEPEGGEASRRQWEEFLDRFGFS